MTGPSDAEEVIFAATGARTSVVYARRTNGKMLAKEFLDSDKKIKKAFGPLIDYLATHGRITNEDLFKKMGGMDDVWEFRKGGNRLYCVQDGNRWLLTHPYKKGGSRQEQTRAGREALAIAAEHRAWEAARITKKAKPQRR